MELSDTTRVAIRRKPALPARRSSAPGWPHGGSASEAQMIAIAKQLYAKLDPWQTRVLKLQYASLHEPLVAEILSADVIAVDGLGVRYHDHAEIIRYSALSYCWGSPQFTHSITCNGINYPITEHLAEALAHVRQNIRDDQVLYLWTDALCINQFDLGEKSTQVKMMLKIFEKAEKVIAWLGTLLSDGLNIFEQISRYALSMTDASELSPRDQADRTVLLAEELQDGFDRILRQPWFKRTWVRQEVFAADELVLQSGPYLCSYRRFMADLVSIYKGQRRVQRMWSTISTTAPMFESSMPPSIRVLSVRSSHNVPIPNPSPEAHHPTTRYVGHVLSVLSEGNYFEATDPRDRIYGVMGIIESDLMTLTLPDFRARFFGGARKFPVDYTKSMSEVYQHLVKYFCAYDRDFSILSVFQQRRDPSTLRPQADDHVASWAIDWRDTRPRYFASRIITPKSTKAKSASQEAPQSPNHNPIQRTNTTSFHEDLVNTPSSTLRIRGTLLGRISWPAPALTSGWSSLDLVNLPPSSSQTENNWTEVPTSAIPIPRGPGRAVQAVSRVSNVGPPTRMHRIGGYEENDGDGDAPVGGTGHGRGTMQKCGYKAMLLSYEEQDISLMREGERGMKFSEWVFVSEVVRVGDLLVRVEGSGYPFVVREELGGGVGGGEGEKYFFLGPAIILRPYAEMEGGLQMLGKSRVVMRQVDGEDILWGSRGVERVFDLV